jgi:ATP-dependent DNA helicase DinG
MATTTTTTGLSNRAQQAVDAAHEAMMTLDRRNPLLRDLPDWFREFRPHQLAAVRDVMAAYGRGAEVVVLDAPTGAGKTMIAEAVRRLLKVRGIYVCTTKSLQDQFLAAYPYAKLLKGRSNYPTELRASDFHPAEYVGHVSCEDCTLAALKSCSLCLSKASCPYEIAKRTTLKAKVAVLNSAYYLAEANAVGKFSSWEKGVNAEDDGGGAYRRSEFGDFTIVDEFDMMESSLMGYVSVDISERRMVKYGWYPPDKVTVPPSWLEWLEKTIPDIQQRLDALGKSVETMKEYTYLDRLLAGLSRIRRDLRDGAGSWVYTGQGNEGTGRKGTKNLGRAVSFKPSRVDGIGQMALWRHAKKWLCMTGTTISAQARMEHLGGNGLNWELVRVANTFPKENRRVVWTPAGNMAAKYAGESWPKLVKKVSQVVEENPGHRILVHSVSYKLTEYLWKHVKPEDRNRRVFSYLNAAGREAALMAYAQKENSILLAPSMDRGIDLPGDLCRVQVITKLPFPYLGDRQVSARLHSSGGQLWYTMQTIATIIQMCGRGVRSESDWAVTYVMDEQFRGLFSSNRGLFPKWFAEAIEWR